MKCLLLIAALAAVARAQIPSLGFCPEYQPMIGFDMERFSGIWHEAERYFQLTEVASRCVTSNYTKTASGKYYVINEVLSRFTGVKRVLEGEIRRSPLKGEEGKLHVKYTTVPFIPLETQYNVLETDYDNYAVLWSCAGVGPVHTQNAWIMTRQRLAPGEVLQKAYGVLDKYKISKVFFVKTNQDDCAYLEENQVSATVKPTEPPKNIVPAEAAEETSSESEEAPAPLAGKSAGEIREQVVPDAPEVIIQMRKSEIDAKEKVAEVTVPIKAATVQQPIVEAVQADEAVRSVPEVILKIADQAKEPQQSDAPFIEAIKMKAPFNREPITLEDSMESIKKASDPEEINKEIPLTLEAVAEPAKPLSDEPAPATIKEAPVITLEALPKEAAVAAPAVAAVEVKEPEVQPLKKPEPIVEEKIEIAQP